MKRLFSSVLWLICILTVSNCAVPQKTSNVNDSSTPVNDSSPNNTYTINVKTNLNDEEAYLYIADILLRNGYTFRYSDMTLKSISTEFTGISQFWGVDLTLVRIGIHIQGEDNATIVLRGWMRTTNDADDQTGVRVTETGIGGSSMRKAWAELISVASEINGTITLE